MRQFIAFSLSLLLSLTSANAYVSQNLEGKKLQVESIILLNEDGTPRCRMGEEVDHEAATNLRECDESDQLFAGVGEEIRYGALSPSVIGKTLLVSAALGTATSCLMIGVGKSFDSEDPIHDIGALILLTMIPVGGLGSLIAAAEYIGAAAGGAAAFTAISSFLFGAASGTFLCHRPEKETQSYD